MPPWERYQQSSGPWAKYQGASEPSAPITAGGLAKSFGSGVARGAAGLVGLPSTVATGIVDPLIDKATQAMGFEHRGPRPAPPMLPTPQQAQAGIESVTGPLRQPQNTAEQYASTIGEFAPGLAFGGPRQAITNVVAPALASETAGQLTKGTAAEPYARAAGAVGGAFVPGMARRAVTPLPTNAERTAAVKTLREEGVTSLSAGQKTGRQGLRYFESEKGGRAGGKLMERQAEEFTAAALKRAGINARRATPEVIDEAFDRIGGKFDDLAARNDLSFDEKLGRELVEVFNDYTAVVPPNARAPVVESTLRELVEASNALKAQGTQTIAGAAYQALRSRMDKAARSARVSDPQLAEALRGIREALDSGMERSIRSMNPRDAGAWKNARRDYRNMLVIEKAATSAGENAAQGLISPSALRQATVQQGRRGYARGKGDFAKLARAGETVMKPLPQSGTAPRLAAQGVSHAIGAGAGAFAGGQYGGSEGAAAGALLGLLGPRALAGAALSTPGRAYLGNQALPNVPSTLQRIALPAVLGSRQLRE